MLPFTNQQTKPKPIGADMPRNHPTNSSEIRLSMGIGIVCGAGAVLLLLLTFISIQSVALIADTNRGINKLIEEVRYERQDQIQSPPDDPTTLERVIRDVGIEDKQECVTYPSPDDQNKNPVAILNLQVGSEANYDCVTICLDPPINQATLEIDNENGKWMAKAKKKMAAKHEAAYLAIMDLFPELESQLDYEPIREETRPCRVPAKDEDMVRVKC